MAHPPHARNKSSAHKSETHAGAFPRSQRDRRPRFLSRPLALLDQFPTLTRVFQLIVLARWVLGWKEKIAQRIFVQYAMQASSLRCFVKVDSVIVGAIAVEL